MHIAGYPAEQEYVQGATGMEFHRFNIKIARKGNAGAKTGTNKPVYGFGFINACVCVR